MVPEVIAFQGYIADGTKNEIRELFVEQESSFRSKGAFNVTEVDVAL